MELLQELVKVGVLIISATPYRVGLLPECIYLQGFDPYRVGVTLKN